MAVTMADITKLRKMTGAGMMDCKNALTEAGGSKFKLWKYIRFSRRNQSFRNLFR